MSHGRVIAGRGIIPPLLCLFHWFLAGKGRVGGAVNDRIIIVKKSFSPSDGSFLFLSLLSNIAIIFSLALSAPHTIDNSLYIPPVAWYNHLNLHMLVREEQCVCMRNVLRSFFWAHENIGKNVVKLCNVSDWTILDRLKITISTYKYIPNVPSTHWTILFNPYCSSFHPGA